MEASPQTLDAPRQGFRLPTFQNVWRASSLVASYASLNVLGRIVQMTGAFLIVRSLAKTEYAWYSLANSLVAALGMFTVTGIGTGLMPLAGEAAHDRRKLGAVLASAARFRATLLLVGGLAAVPVFACLLLRSGCQPLTTTALVLAAVLSVRVSIATQMFTTPLSLVRRYSIPQWENIMSSAVRLGLIALLVAAGFTDSVTVMMGTVLAPLPTVFGWLLPKAREHAAFEQQPEPAATIRLRKHFLVGLPTSLTYLFEAQIAAIILSFFAHIDQVADLGAISRVALILQVPLSIASGVLLPRMAAEHDPARLWKMWTGSSLLAAVSGVAVLALGWMLREPLLQLLGPEYAGLQQELVFFLAFQVFAFVVTVAATPIQSKGWVRHSWARPLLVFGSQAVAACFLDLSTVNGAIALMWAGSAGNLLLNAFLLVNGWRGRASL